MTGPKKAGGSDDLEALLAVIDAVNYGQENRNKSEQGSPAPDELRNFNSEPLNNTEQRPVALDSHVLRTDPDLELFGFSGGNNSPRSEERRTESARGNLAAGKSNNSPDGSPGVPSEFFDLLPENKQRVTDPLGLPAAFDLWAAEYQIRPGSVAAIPSADLMRHFDGWVTEQRLEGRQIAEFELTVEKWRRQLDRLGLTKGRETRGGRDMRPYLMRAGVAKYFREWLERTGMPAVGTGPFKWPGSK